MVLRKGREGNSILRDDESDAINSWHVVVLSLLLLLALRWLR